MPESETPSPATKIKVVARSDPKFDLMRFFAGSGALANTTDSTVAGELLQHFNTGRSSPTLVHGLRIQSMFGYVAAGLGNCRYVKEEDAGELYYEGNDMLIPDYRIQTLSGWEALVEVKNHHGDIEDPFSITLDYLEKLQRYAEMMHLPLLFAVYWSRYRRWSLVRPTDFTKQGERLQLTFLDGIKFSHMAELGDVMIGTVPPLQLRLQADRALPRTVGLDGKTPFTIGDVQLLSQERLLAGGDAHIAWFLIQFGSWPERETIANVENGLLNSMTMSYSTPERSPDQPFEIIGTLSSMISEQYNAGTVADGKVHSLIPNNKPGELGLIIPREYTSTALPLWRFVTKPPGTTARENPSPPSTPAET